MKEKRDLTDYWIVAISLILFLVSCALLFDDQILFRLGIHKKIFLPSVGVIENTNHDVRRRTNVDVVWHRALHREDLFELDHIFTGEDSEAMLKLKDGSEISMDQNSLVVIRLLDGNAVIDLQDGLISGQLGARSRLIIPGENGKTQEIVGNNAQIQVRLKRGKQAELTVVSGEVEIRSTSGGAVVKKTADKNAMSQQYLAPKLISPNHADLLAYEVSAATDRVPATEGMPVFLIWEPAGNIAEFGRFGEKFEVQVAKDELFKSVPFGAKTAATRIQTGKLAEGEYFWRVRVKGSFHKDGPWSEVRKFQIQSKIKDEPDIILPPPRILEPEYEFEMDSQFVPQFQRNIFEKTLRSLSNLFYAEAFAEEPIRKSKEKKRPVLRWEQVEKAKGYRIEISKDVEFGSVLLRKDLETSEFKWIDCEPGEFYWRVSSLNSKGTAGPSSAAAHLRIRVVPPKLVSPKLKIVKHDEIAVIKLEWNKINLAKSYEIQFSSTPDFAKALARNVSKNEFYVKFNKTGRYFWRVRALGNKNIPISRFSMVENADVKYLPPPVVVAVKSAPIVPTRKVASVEKSEATQRIHNAESLGEPLKRVHLGLGAATSSYKQTNVTDFSQMEAFAEIGYRGDFLWRNWSMALSGAFTAMPVTSSLAGVNVRYIQVGATAGHTRILSPGSSILTLGGGWNYKTMLVSNDFGYQNIHGPQLNPELAFKAGKSSVIKLGLKYSFVASSLSALSASNNEISGGLKWNYLMQSKNAISVGIEFNRLSLVGIDLVDVQTQTISLGVAYEW